MEEEMEEMKGLLASIAFALVDEACDRQYKTLDLLQGGMGQEPALASKFREMRKESEEKRLKDMLHLRNSLLSTATAWSRYE